MPYPTNPTRTRTPRACARLRLVAAWLALAFGPAVATAANTQVAVAANFAAPMKVIAQQFTKDTGHTTTLVFGATGQLFAQLKNGAPFDVLLAADEQTPQALLDSGLAVASSRFTYATGRLVLWSANPVKPIDSHTLAAGQFKRLAVASPKLAPYGLAAKQTIASLGLGNDLSPKLIEGSSITQAFQFVATGNAELGFVALSQLTANGAIASGAAWLVPAALHSPIRQDAVLLRSAAHNPAALALMQYLRSGPASATMRAFGYQ